MLKRTRLSKALVFCITVYLLGGTYAMADDKLDLYNVVWTTASEDESDFMPIGNGDIGMTVWAEPDGDLMFYVTKNDSASENDRLLKLGRVRVKLSPNPFAKGLPFRQELKLRQGQIVITAGPEDAPVSLRLWVDANYPVIRVEAESKEAFEMEVNFETWRETGYMAKNITFGDLYNVKPSNAAANEDNIYPTVVFPDVIVPGEKNRIVWYHHNVKSGWPLNMKLLGLETLMPDMTDPLLSRTFGGAIKGNGFVLVGDRVLKSEQAGKKQSFSVYPLTKHPATVTEWMANLDELIAGGEKLDIEKSRREHYNWWNDFWNRSWIRISGSDDGQTVSNGYTLFRYMVGCAGRGALPIKFNGALFTGTYQGDPDYRSWGHHYPAQNQRLIYWPLTASGDFDLLQPFFKMYMDILPLCRQRTKIYYGHEGTYFTEGLHFWGTDYNFHRGWDREGKDVSYMAHPYVKWHWQSGLELLAIMLDYYRYTQDEDFLHEKFLPMADEVITFYDQHYKHDENGKLYIYPSQSLETWWNCANPAPELAGLRFMLNELLGMDNSLTSKKQRKHWKRFLGELPELPRRKANGETILAAAESFEDTQTHNIENPELYAVFPYRLYGLDKPDLEMARKTFDNRLHVEGNFGHDQDGIHAAYLGLTEKVREFLPRRFGSKYLASRFPTMWHGGYDWPPDYCHGGAGMIALQAMLMQCEDKKIILFPTWPKEWDVEFKLHAPYNTTVEGIYKDSKVTVLIVKPESRKKDLVIMGQK
ncbi:DUF5703 domain-containing protein [Planctomycetota bacterium]